MFTLDVLANISGILGIVAAILAFQCKQHSKLMLFRTANELLFALQYCIMGAYTGMAMNLIGCVRNLVFAGMVERKKDTMAARFFFSGIALVFILFTWEGPKSLLSGVAKTISTFAYGSKHTSVVRILTLFTCTAWLFYNVLVGSRAGILCELLTIGSIMIGILRMDLRKKDKA